MGPVVERETLVMLWWRFAPQVLACRGEPIEEDCLPEPARRARAQYLDIAGELRTEGELRAWVAILELQAC